MFKKIKFEILIYFFKLYRKNNININVKNKIKKDLWPQFIQIKMIYFSIMAY